jgi:hypothetical protein
MNSDIISDRIKIDAAVTNFLFDPVLADLCT